MDVINTAIDKLVTGTQLKEAKSNPRVIRKLKTPIRESPKAAPLVDDISSARRPKRSTKNEATQVPANCTVIIIIADVFGSNSEPDSLKIFPA